MLAKLPAMRQNAEQDGCLLITAQATGHAHAEGNMQLTTTNRTGGADRAGLSPVCERHSEGSMVVSGVTIDGNAVSLQRMQRIRPCFTCSMRLKAATWRTFR